MVGTSTMRAEGEAVDAGWARSDRVERAAAVLNGAAEIVTGEPSPLKRNKSWHCGTPSSAGGRQTCPTWQHQPPPQSTGSRPQTLLMESPRRGERGPTVSRSPGELAPSADSSSNGGTSRALI
ncbi:hypothetical protein BDY21DRAFT_358857 [Lineolata rhizophorae]|uniref:Uncharacterized protein n=1 Tax=Lineolata rhizophorae TaxID=578093 RepID=A0A6A6NM55_9PEZI|nr:hypothetical protein BDY21DRAFT_358857 [Lineolata rhizophorae]